MPFFVHVVTAVLYSHVIMAAISEAFTNITRLPYRLYIPSSLLNSLLDNNIMYRSTEHYLNQTCFFLANSIFLTASSTMTLSTILNTTEARRDVILVVRTEPVISLETPPPSWFPMKNFCTHLRTLPSPRHFTPPTRPPPPFCNDGPMCNGTGTWVTHSEKLGMHNLRIIKYHH